MRSPRLTKALTSSKLQSVSSARKRVAGWVQEPLARAKTAVQVHTPTAITSRLPLGQPKNSRQSADVDASPDTPDDHSNSIRHFANPGPGFEDRGTPSEPPLQTIAKAVAFYLPQFYPFEENNKWWGDGFTEWRNVARGTPRFKGHYQPRIPRDLGFYDLKNVDTIKAQAALARSAGIEAFCFYYYWFNGKRLMDKPLDLFVDNDIDQEFCIMWANENWTRRWDGRENDVLIAQNYAEEDEKDFLADVARYMAHPRYMTVNGRPLFILYRASLIPDPATTIGRWRKAWTKSLGVEPLIFMVQSYDDRNPLEFGCDGAMEFPPHKVSKGIRRRNQEHQIFDPNYNGQIRRYSDVVKKSLNESAPDYPLIKTVSPSWDNDARREGSGVTFQGSTPAAYADWLTGAIKFSEENPVDEKPVVFINAWNEWAEAAYLEPDVHYGHAYLNATYRVLVNQSKVPVIQHHKADLKHKADLILVGHDAHANGAQMLLLSLAKFYKEHLGLNVRVLLKSGGALLKEYEKTAPTTLLENIADDDLTAWFQSAGCQSAIFNTSCTGDLLWAAKDANINCVSLVHELPALIKEFKLQPHIRAIAKMSDHVVFPSDHVQNGFHQFQSQINNTVSIKPQGLYKKIRNDSIDRLTTFNKLGIPDSAKIVLNVGYADQRKGFDCFVSAALRLCPIHKEVHFCWVGKRSKEMSRWLKGNVAKKLKGRLHLIEFTDDISPWYAAADALYLSSREDPFPSVALEAMSLGMPVIVHDGATGFDEALLGLMNITDLEKPTSIDDAILYALRNDRQSSKEERIELIKNHYQIDEYGKKLLEYLDSMKNAIETDQSNTLTHTETMSQTQQTPTTSSVTTEPDISL